MPRAREIGISIGVLPTGPTNSVLDVAGVGLGHATLVRDEPAPPEGRGTARTGVTTLLLAEDAYTRPLAAGGAVLNGAGECTGFLTAAEWGADRDAGLPDLDDAAGPRVRRRVPDRPGTASRRGRRGGDPGRRRVRRLLPQRLPGDAGRDRRRPGVVAARRSTRAGRSAPPAEGAVGAGTGMSCLGFKGGIGTSSRVTPAGHTVAVLLLTNFGERKRLTVDGVPVGSLLPPADDGPDRPAGSCIGVVVTDAPVGGSRLRPARPPDRARASHGPARPATTAAARSSSPPRPPAVPIATAARRTAPAWPDAASTTSSRPWSTPPRSRCSTRCSAPSTTVGRDGNTIEGLDPAVVSRLLEEAGRAGH